MNDPALVAALFTPLFAGLMLHGFAIKYRWMKSLTVPIDRGVTLRGRRLFGANKTYRGLLAVAAGAALGYALQGLWPTLQAPPLRHLGPLRLAAFGFALGFASMLAELPNSFLKRQLDIAAGAPGQGCAAPLFYVYDQVDFLLGAWLVAWPWVAPTAARLLWSVLFVVVGHQALSLAGARLGMRATAR